VIICQYLHVKLKQSKAKQSKAKQSKAKQSKAKQSKAKPVDTEKTEQKEENLTREECKITRFFELQTSSYKILVYGL
jgi:hypothetical protein